MLARLHVPLYVIRAPLVVAVPALLLVSLDIALSRTIRMVGPHVSVQVLLLGAAGPLLDCAASAVVFLFMVVLMFPTKTEKFEVKFVSNFLGGGGQPCRCLKAEYSGK